MRIGGGGDGRSGFGFGSFGFGLCFAGGRGFFDSVSHLTNISRQDRGLGEPITGDDNRRQSAIAKRQVSRQRLPDQPQSEAEHHDGREGLSHRQFAPAALRMVADGATRAGIGQFAHGCDIRRHFGRRGARDEPAVDDRLVLRRRVFGRQFRRVGFDGERNFAWNDRRCG